MGYRFIGFFARTDADEYPALAEAVKYQWPGVRVRRVAKPFSGIAAAAFIDPDMEKEYDLAIETVGAIEDELPKWSGQYRDKVFVFLDADCFGGVCHYLGFVCQNGRVVERAEGEDDRQNLHRLLSHLNVTLPVSGYFAPLVRGYFDSDVIRAPVAANDRDDITEEARAEVRAGIERGLQAAAEGRERPLNEYIADVQKRRMQ